jgi:hypothetical protein
MSKKQWFIGIIFLLWPVAFLLHGFGKKTYFSAPQNSAIARIALDTFCAQSDGTDFFDWSLEIDRYQSFNSNKIAQYLFGAESLTFSGSLVPNRAPSDILADYFGLPLDFKSIVSFNPVITNWLVNFSGYWNMDCVAEGLYFWLDVPFVETIWDLRLREHVEDMGMLAYPAGYFSTQSIARTATNISQPVLATDVEDVFKGDTTVGDQREPLRFGKIFGRQNGIRLADLHVRLGWHSAADCRGQIGAYLLAAAPTTNHSKAEFLFETMVSNQGHWQIGGGINGCYLWDLSSVCSDLSLNISFDCALSHLFKSRQHRSFDLKNNGTGSRYMLLAAVGSPSHDLLVGGAAPSVQYEGLLVPAINYTTLKTMLSIALQGSITLQCDVAWRNHIVRLGYIFWGRSHETLKSRDAFESNRFALKGDSQIYGFRATDQSPVQLSFSQSKATLQAAQAPSNFVTGLQLTNANIDAPQLATDATGTVLNQLPTPQLGFTVQQVNASRFPVILQDSDLDIASGLMPRSLSNSLFFEFRHEWSGGNGAVTLKPYLNFGGSVEIASPSPEKNSACPQWGLWIGGGIAYF